MHDVQVHATNSVVGKGISIVVDYGGLCQEKKHEQKWNNHEGWSVEGQVGQKQEWRTKGFTSFFSLVVLKL